MRPAAPDSGLRRNDDEDPYSAGMTMNCSQRPFLPGSA
jgi:hypothetical protein